MLYSVKLVEFDYQAVSVLCRSLEHGRQDIAVVECWPPREDKVDPWCVVFPRTKVIGEEIKGATGWRDHLPDSRGIFSIFAPCDWEGLKKILNEVFKRDLVFNQTGI